jgi:hypothetical protein
MALVCPGPVRTSVTPLDIARDSPVRGEFLAFVVKLGGDFTDSRASARPQQVRQGREFDRDIDHLRWKRVEYGLRGPPWEIHGAQ